VVSLTLGDPLRSGTRMREVLARTRYIVVDDDAADSLQTDLGAFYRETQHTRADDVLRRRSPGQVIGALLEFES
jgi:hypothetical protein